MSQACSACTVAPAESRWKAVALLVGAIVFCPCHLPLTIAAFATALGAAWLTGHAALLYVAFGLTYLFVVFMGARYVMRHRDRERAIEAMHAEHAPPAATAAPSS